MKYEINEPDCGIACCKPKALRPLANIKCFTAFYSCAGIVVASLSMYIVSQITTIERQFGLNSGQTGYLMACNDIGYAITILIASHFSSRAHIPWILCLSTLGYGISGIICTIPHFIYEYETPGSSVAVIQHNFTNKAQTKLCTNISSVSNSETNATDLMLATAHKEKQSDYEMRTAAMTFIAIGMILQGFCKAPRFPMLTQYLDDNTKKQETGFYMGIITGLSIFGPAVAYGLGGVFSQIYVTLEDVDLHPRDPRWLGAWWLGFLAFGIAAIVFGIPLMFFSKSLVPKQVKSKQQAKRKVEIRCGTIYREFKDFLKSIIKVLRVPLYTIPLLSTLVSMVGISSTMGFIPKYIEKQFNVTAWEANIMMAVTGLISLCIGSFAGGLLTKKIKLNPRRALLLIFVASVITFIFTLVAMFLSCEPPVVQNWDSKSSSLADKPEHPSCMSKCSCRSDQFLPICGSDGMNYYSPCHAGCSEGNITTFTSCSCIQDGVATSGLCKSSCPLLWPWNILNFVSALIGSFTWMPMIIYYLRIVPDDVKSMGVGILALCMSLFGKLTRFYSDWQPAHLSFFLYTMGLMYFVAYADSSKGTLNLLRPKKASIPGPVLGGKLVDAACILWSPTGACAFYDNDSMRYNLYGVNIGCRALGILILSVAVIKSWNMRTWSGNAKDETPEVSENDKKLPEAHNLMEKCTVNSKR